MTTYSRVMDYKPGILMGFKSQGTTIAFKGKGYYLA